MSRARVRHLRQWIAARNRRWKHPVLARSLAHLRDDAIDDALRRAGLSRATLFTARGAIAQHRVRMAHMLAALEIDLDEVVATDWEAMKKADQTCSRCPQAGRCRRWLEWGRTNDAPEMFCSNSAIFKHFAAEQVKRSLGQYLI